MINKLIKGEHSYYKIVELLGQGGMGRVYKGVDLLTDDYVAIKIPSEIPVAINKLEFEKTLLKSLIHRYIVNYYDSSKEQNLPVLIEEFINGYDLSIYRKHENIDNYVAKKIIIEILLSVDYLHSMNIIHRDIKPKNIIYDSDRKHVKLLDLGTAIYFNVAGLSDIVFSTGGYTAPEQYHGVALPQSDIWAVMATAFYLLTGKDPAAFMHGYPNWPPRSPPDPRIVNPDADRLLSEAVVRGLAWNVLDRFLTAREALDFIVKGKYYNVNVLIFEIFGITIPITTRSMVFGRMMVQKDGTTIEGLREDGITVGVPKVVWRREGDVTFVFASDPRNWVSRYHFEILNFKNKWCIRDLGSTNRTAVMTRAGLFEVWAGRHVVSHCVPLGDRAIILIAYGNSIRNPPYITAVFRAPA